MRFINLLVFCFALLGINAQLKDGCPKNNVACLDIINSSQCLEELVIGNNTPATAAAMINCIDTDASSSNLPGATKVCKHRLRGDGTSRKDDTKECYANVTVVSSSANVLVVILRRSQMPSHNYSCHRVLEGSPESFL